MSESQRVITELKRQLKLRDIQYTDVAKQLDLSEASVKRLLAEGTSLSLERLNAICTMIGIEMGELFQLANAHNRGLKELTYEQEKQLIDDKVLLLVSVCAINGYSCEDILEQYDLSKNELTQKLALLDRLKIIDLLPGDRIRLKVSPAFRWIPGGPIQVFFHQHVLNEFFRSYFNKPEEKLVMSTGLLSNASHHKLQNKIDKLVSDFYATCKEDTQLNMEERHGTSMVVALRPWNLPLFDQLEKS
ncbi:helix-turn-helix domain-containing protein [Vibrio sonorensis]|uniref:helix-turn-helix domain-containing protein n=1 Tax=Vibrio sonorensis TaxID=1004316 RepID=UPI0008DA8BB9|nr:helix-turn-helix transcriptional regulator [Vibrio sonorensis]